MAKRDLMWFLTGPPDVPKKTAEKVGKSYAKLNPKQQAKAAQLVDKAFQVRSEKAWSAFEASNRQVVGGISHRQAAADVVRAVRKVQRAPTGVRGILVDASRYSAKGIQQFEALPPKYRSAVGYAAKESENLTPRARAAHVLRTIRQVGRKAAESGSSKASLMMEFVGASSFMRREERRRMTQ